MFQKVKKIHKIIFLFSLIFILGIYYTTLYIGNTMDEKTNTQQPLHIQTIMQYYDFFWKEKAFLIFLRMKL